MKVNFPNVQNGIINGLNSIGNAAYDAKDMAVNYSKQLKAKLNANDTFVKAKDALSSKGIGKKTFVGAAVVAATVACAIKTVKGIADKVKQMKNK